MRERDAWAEGARLFGFLEWWGGVAVGTRLVMVENFSGDSGGALEMCFGVTERKL